MNLLLDSHVLIWWLNSPEELSAEASDAIGDPDNVVLFSVAAAWELWIKQAKERVRVPDDLAAALRDARILQLGVLLSHARRAAGLPRIHGDPFDRMMIAQAMIEDLVLVTRDGKIPLYEGVRTLTA